VLSISQTHSDVYRNRLHFVVIVVSDTGQIPIYQLSLVTSLRGVQWSSEVLVFAKMKTGVFWSVTRCIGLKMASKVSENIFPLSSWQNSMPIRVSCHISETLNINALFYCTVSTEALWLFILFTEALDSLQPPTQLWPSALPPPPPVKSPEPHRYSACVSV
jgi:hypothetical protein